MSIPIIPSLLRNNLAELAAEGKRLDNRGQLEGRDLEIAVSYTHLTLPTKA